MPYSDAPIRSIDIAILNFTGKYYLPLKAVESFDLNHCKKAHILIFWYVLLIFLVCFIDFFSMFY